MNKKFLGAMIKVLTLCIIIFIISAIFIYNTKLVGVVIFILGLFSLLALKFFRIPVRTVWPDIVFGIIDNGILAILAVIGGEIAGVAGAIIGGTVGNALTDGIAGVFEGSIAEKLRENQISEERTMIGSSVGKMAGCLLGAGVVLVLSSIIISVL